jgi:hippurate hydrolase
LGTAKLAGSEDFAFVTEKVPATMMMISAGSSEAGHPEPLHHPKAHFDESVLSQGAAVYAITALNWLQQHK